ncbi:glucose-1-dehydrogenase [Fibrella aestuarina BUZ 2]|uniref:Glucose-1-dehydrogenase n=1 Tax=Fibrella aestuarina BUZ 2 TaxID=1166018 RepID=I0K9Q8_9BACT|nr:SDR family oxidoreductase [Fibrella aestuarina]CCH00861.1 glucose-1-dehydrogenase [Fibrella aestuarina BUZ 2]
MRFTDKVCLITGATSGIGRAVALQMGTEGGKVAVIGRKPDEGDEVLGAFGELAGEAMFIQADIADAAAIQRAVQQTIDRWGRVDVLVNNAAKMTFTPIVELTIDDWDDLMATNLRSAFLFCKYCIPHMNGGAIVNVSSVHAHQTTPNVVPYAASKGALEAFTRGLSLEHPRATVRVNCVAPGAVDTPMLWDNPNVKANRETIDMTEVGQPEDLASVICFLASDEARFINGTTLVADGGRLDKL